MIASRRLVWGCGAVALLLAGPLEAQQDRDPIEFGALLRTGFRVDPEETGRNDGFELFDARARVSGQVSLVFDYLLQVEYDASDRTFRLLDAAALIPLIPEFEVSLGLFRPQFGLEASVDGDRGDLTFLERAQATEAIAPGRQLGVGIGGSTFDGRLSYGGGVFNGNGRSATNDGDGFMFSARALYNSIGTIAFYEDLMIQVGASVAHSKDVEAPLGTGLGGGPTPELFTDQPLYAGKRLLYGADVKATYRKWALTGEYYGASLTPDPGDPRPADAKAHGGYVEAGFRIDPVVDLVARYDAFKPIDGGDRRFMLFGVNLYPGVYGKIGVQYAVALRDSSPAPTVAGNQFIAYAQIDF
jgi:hypothetical protein